MKTIKVVDSVVMRAELARDVDARGGWKALFGKGGIETMVMSEIADGVSRDIPTCELKFGFVRLVDCIWSLSDGRAYSLTDPKVSGLVPMARLDATLAEAWQLPKHWMAHLRHLVPDNDRRAQFIRAFRGLMEPRRPYPHHLGLSLLGHRKVGKDTIYTPFMYIFGPLVLELEHVDKFSFEPGYHITYLRDAMLKGALVEDHGAMSILKQLREGCEYWTQVKHGKPVESKPQHFMHSSNDTDLDWLATNAHAQAILSRCAFQFCGRERMLLSDDADGLKDRIRQESAQVMVWLTRGHSDQDFQAMCMDLGVSSEPRPVSVAEASVVNRSSDADLAAMC